MKIAFDPTTELHLLHPITGDKLYADSNQSKPSKPMIAVLYGKHTKEYKNALAKVLKSSSKKDDLNDAKNKGLKLLVACIKEFKNLDIETENGKLDPEDPLSVITDAFWIKDQIDGAIMDTENFIQASN